MSIIRPAPIADQVNTLLRERIREGTYAPGERLPSESDLCVDLGVSRATIRTVLAKLAAEGLILRKQGDGTYVNEHIQESTTQIGGLWEFGRLIETSGYKPSIKPLSIVRRLARESEKRALNLGDLDEVLALKRLFLADDSGVILANNSLPIYLLDSDVKRLDGSLNIREFLWQYCHRKIAYAVSDVKSVIAGKELIDVLDFQENRPILKIHMVFYDRDNRPLVCGHSYFDDSRLRLRLIQAWGG